MWQLLLTIETDRQTKRQRRKRQQQQESKKEQNPPPNQNKKAEQENKQNQQPKNKKQKTKKNGQTNNNEITTTATTAPQANTDGTPFALTAESWWMVDRYFCPPLRREATPLVERCMREFDWTEEYTRRVLNAYR